MSKLALSLLAFFLLSCAAAAPPAASPAAEAVRLTAIADGVWIHTTWGDYQGTAVPSNGLIVRDGSELVLVDTAWGAELETEALLAAIEKEIGLPVREAIITHWHDDRLGGGNALARRGIPFRAHRLTRRIAIEKGLPVPEALEEVAEPGSAATAGGVEIFYPGPGHALDNLVVWVPARKVLFGGCAVRAAATSSKGNLSDANVEEWPRSIRRVIDRYPEAEIVVPGHGAHGPNTLLQHTLKVVE